MPRIVLVTGCSTGGIGYSLCEEFARQGCKVYATSRNIETIADFDDGTIEKVYLDVTSDESVQNALNYIVEKEDKIDVVVNNAGLLAPGTRPLVEQPLDNVKQIFDTNAFSILRVCKAVVPIMAKRHSGTIVNIGSIVGEISTPWNGLYCASKAAVNSISEVLSMELKPFNISVLHVAPGAVKSNIASNAIKRFGLAPDSLYSDFLWYIIKRIEASQDAHSMPSKDFAEEVVSNVLQKKPARYMSIGGRSQHMTVTDHKRRENVKRTFAAQPLHRCNLIWKCLDDPPVESELDFIMSKYPDYLTPNVTPTKLSKGQKSRARREPSGVFSLFQAPQIQQFKEAFQLIDHDKDGWVNESDLKEIFTSLGISPSRRMMDDLLSARPGGHNRSGSYEATDRGINFTMFLTMMSERLFEFDTETELVEAFGSFDENDTGLVKVEEMRKWLSEVGERMSEEEIERFLKGSFTDRQGHFNYREWIKVLRVNDNI